MLTLKDYLYMLLKARVAKLKADNNAASKCKKYKKKQIQAGRTLLQAKAEEIVR
jgi:hypothetical protein